MIQAKIVADSKNGFGNRITTMVITFPRIIHSELMTHRMFSKNSASSRAIPFEKMLKSVEENPFIPIAWQKDHKGMQGTEYADIAVVNDMRDQWLAARDVAINKAKLLSQYGLTKQLCNRLLEPFMWYTVIVTATEWENFFALRCPQYVDETYNQVFRSKKDFLVFRHTQGHNTIDWDTIQWLKANKGQAEIHMMALAEAMWDAMNESTPQELKDGEWHIPFGDDLENGDVFKLVPYEIPESGPKPNVSSYFNNLKVKIATARCARVSYTVVGEEGKEANYENDIKLHDRLRESGHMSPFEHCAKAMNKDEYNSRLFTKEGQHGWSGNFRGFIQYRKTLPNENITK